MQTIVSLSKILEESQRLEPQIIDDTIITTVSELDLNAKIGKLRSTRSVPPDYFDALDAISNDEYKKIIVNSLRKIYGYISSLKKSPTVIGKFKKGKFESGKSDVQATSLSELLTIVKTISSKNKRLVKTKEALQTLEEKDEMTNKQSDRAFKLGEEIESLSGELESLVVQLVFSIQDTEASIAGLGLK